MSAQVYDFNLRFNAETVQFSEDVEYARRMLRGYATDAHAANDNNTNLSQSFSDSVDSVKSLSSELLKASGVIAGAASGVVAATALLVTQQADAARELERMATVSDLSVERIQALSYASEQYNISGDKMADILKDVNDKLGDFSENEGGEFVDFMENIAPKVGITIEQLQELSGPDALIAVKSAMDEANVPMKSQIFYLESIADEASALMPLLADSGQKLSELTQRYDDLNVSMSEYDIEKFKQMDQKLTDIALKFERSFANAVLGASDQIDWFTDKIIVATDYWGTLFDSWSDTPRTANGLRKKLSELRDEIAVLTDEKKELTSKRAEYDGVDISSLLPLNPVGKSTNEHFNLQVEYGMVSNKLVEAQNEYDRLQKLYNVRELKINYKPNPLQNGVSQVEEVNGQVDGAKDDNQVEVNQLQLENQRQFNQRQLEILDKRYASEQEKMRMVHEQRLADIEALNASTIDIEARGFESLAHLKESYIALENAQFDEQQAEFERKQDEAIERELAAYIAKEEAKNEAAKKAAEEREAIEEGINKEIFTMQSNIVDQILDMTDSRLKHSVSIHDSTASQILAVVEATAKKGSLIQKAAFLAQRAMAAMQVFQQGEVAATAALAPPPIGLGPVEGQLQAGVIRAMSSVSAGLIMGQTISGMAHSGMDYIPSEGTWLLDRGERVYTNDSARKIDHVSNAIFDIQKRLFSKSASNNTVNNQSSRSVSVSVPQYFQFSGSSTNDQVEDAAEKMKAAVIEVIQEQSRPGGVLWAS